METARYCEYLKLDIGELEQWNSDNVFDFETCD